MCVRINIDFVLIPTSLYAAATNYHNITEEPKDRPDNISIMLIYT